MPKRKRNEAEDGREVEIEDQALRIRVSRLKAKVEQGCKGIATALKLARGFERQKLGRRTKASQQKPRELLRLKEEVIMLKSLELDSTAERYLVKQLAKTKRIKESPAFLQVYGIKPNMEGPRPGVEANIIARLFNSNPVKEATREIMSGIYGCLGIEEKTPRSVSTMQEDALRDPGILENTDEVFEGFSDHMSEAESQTVANGNHRSDQASDSEEDLAEYGDRLGSPSDESEEELDGITWRDPIQPLLNSQNHDRTRSERHLKSLSLTVSDSDVSQSPPPQQRPVRPTLQKLASTSFLPSLSLGGYYSGSDSGDDDETDRHYGNTAPSAQLRNNRRGQRARQKIAEKKFGKNAKHLGKQTSQAGNSRDAGWDTKRGATDSNSGRDRFRRSGFRRKVQGPSGANADAVKERSGKGKVDGPLHPSWEAAKKRKEEQQPLLAFAGKKITFD